MEPANHQKANNNFWMRFLYIVEFITFGITALSLTGIAHNGISRLFNTIIHFSDYSDLIFIRIYLSLLLVSFPIFSIVFLYLQHAFSKFPHLKLMSERRQIFYGILVFSFFILFVNLIRLIYSFISGEVSPEFLAHFGADFVIAGAIFAYMLMEIKTDTKLE